MLWTFRVVLFPLPAAGTGAGGAPRSRKTPAEKLIGSMQNLMNTHDPKGPQQLTSNPTTCKLVIT